MIQQLGYSRGLRLLALALFLPAAVPVPAFAQSDELVTNVRFEILPERAYVFFDLGGSASERYEVTVTLRRESDPGFRYTPQNVTGDIGPSVQGGGARRIIWEYTKEYPGGVPGDDFFVVVEALPEKAGGISPVVLVAAGLAVAGGIVALVLSAGGNGDNGGGNGSAGFPAPGGRP